MEKVLSVRDDNLNVLERGGREAAAAAAVVPPGIVGGPRLLCGGVAPPPDLDVNTCPMGAGFTPE